MRRITLRRAPVLLAAALLVAAAAAPAAATTDVIIVSLDDGTGLGFDDPTPVAPVGGNPGTTLGQQRLIAAAFSAQLWGASLDSDAPVFVLATFQPLACTPTAGTLGSAGTTFVFRDFPPGLPTVFPATWYHSALADKLNGADLNPGFGDLLARFNGDIGVNPNCLTGSGWYYGLDHNAAANQFDFLNVLSHELAHGLGFANFVNEATGANFSGFTDIYSWFTLDDTTGTLWKDMTDADRAASAVNDGHVVWSGPAVTARAPLELGPRPRLETSAGDFDAQAASFGPALTVAGTSGTVVLADDGIAPTADACTPLVGDLTGAVALIDRGACTFTAKVINAQNAGAVAAIIANNAPGGPAPMGGADPAVAIPSVGITQAQGDAIKAALPGVTATLRVDPDLAAGANDAGQVRLYAPTVVALGSSISHFDTVATPNLLMEPFITSTLRAADTLDLTPFQMRDIGWTSTVVIDGCDSGVDDTQFSDGSTIADGIAACAAGAANHGAFVSCVAHLTDALKKAGVISGAQQGAITTCASGASIP
jgi:hypothetical protein